MEHHQHLNGEKSLIDILNREEGKLRFTSQLAVLLSSQANQGKKRADVFKCLTQHTFKVPGIQI